MNFSRTRAFQRKRGTREFVEKRNGRFMRDPHTHRNNECTRKNEFAQSEFREIMHSTECRKIPRNTNGMNNYPNSS